MAIRRTVRRRRPAAALGTLLCWPTVALAQQAQPTPFAALSPVQTRVFGESTIRHDYQFSSTEDSASVTQSVNTLTGQAVTRGYLWKPWFSRTSLDANLGLNFLKSSGDEAGQETLGVSLTGTGDITLLPTSRFPFSATLVRDDSRTTTNDDTTMRDRTSLLLVQRYRPLGLWPSFFGSYGYVLTNSDDSQERDQSLDLKVEHQTKRQVMSARLTYDREIEEDLDSGAMDEDTTLSLFGNHSYTPQGDFSIQTFASAVSQEQQTETGDITSELWQVSSNATYYIPARALALSSNFRASQVRNESRNAESSSSTVTDSMAGGLGVEHRPTESIQLGGNLSVDHTISNGTAATSTFESLRASYSPPGIALGEYRYQWSANGSGSFSQTKDASTERISAGLAQGVSRQVHDTERGGSFDFRADQQVTKDLYRSGESDSSKPWVLEHRVSGAWRAQEATLSDFLQLSFRDNREVDGAEDETQLIDLQISRNVRALSGGLWFANYTHQLSRDVADARETVRSMANGNLTYGRYELFRVRGLSFQSALGATYSFDIKSENAEEEEQTFFWNNEMRYELGRLRLELDTRFNWSNDEYNGSVVVEVSRLWDSL